MINHETSSYRHLYFFAGLALFCQPQTNIKGRFSVRLPFDETSIHPENAAQIGVIGQEVKEQFPEVVFRNGEHFGVNYSQLIAVLIEAIKDQ